MKKGFFVFENKRILKIMEQVHDDLIEILKLKKPKAESLTEDKELFALYDVLVLIRSGHLWVEKIFADPGSFYFLEIFEKRRKRPFKNKLTKV